MLEEYVGVSPELVLFAVLKVEAVKAGDGREHAAEPSTAGPVLCAMDK